MRGNANALRTAEFSQVAMAAFMLRNLPDLEPAVTPEARLRNTARRTYCRLRFAYQLWLMASEELWCFDPLGHLKPDHMVAYREIHKVRASVLGVPVQSRQVGYVTVFDRWLAINEAINRLENLYGRIAVQLLAIESGGAAPVAGTHIMVATCPAQVDVLLEQVG
jgi:hypothetical protein